VNVNLILAHLNSEYERCRDSIGLTLPKALGQCSTEEQYIDLLKELEVKNSAELDSLCAYYSIHGVFPKTLSLEQLWLVQYRFGEATLLCHALRYGPTKEIKSIVDPALTDGEVIHWLLVPYWKLVGFQVSSHQQRRRFQIEHH